MTPKVVTLGSFMMDLVAYTPRRPKSGETIRGESFSIALGGKGFNQAIAAGRAGAQSAMLGNLGTDSFGDDFMRAFNEEGVQSSDIERHTDLGTGVGHKLLAISELYFSLNRLIPTSPSFSAGNDLAIKYFAPSTRTPNRWRSSRS